MDPKPAPRPPRSQAGANIFVHVPWRSNRPDEYLECRDSSSETYGVQRIHPTADSTTDTTLKVQSKIRLFFFVPGNPGLVGYYHPFLTQLVGGLNVNVGVNNRGESTEGWSTGEVSKRQTAVVAMSLGGFEVQHEDHSAADAQLEGHVGPRAIDGEERDLLYPPEFQSSRDNDHQRVYSLGEQVELTYARLEHLSHRLQEETVPPQRGIEVVLAGHSVGAYICLEIVRLWHERHRVSRNNKALDSHTVASSAEAISTAAHTPGPQAHWTVSTCILLTPTIQDIHLSPSGLIATPLLTHLSFLPSLAHILVHSILVKLPESWFLSLVSTATGMARNSHGLQTTSAFLKSERGVKQALYMAGGEMKEIRQDKWGEEVWGASHNPIVPEGDEGQKHHSPRLFFWFAREDHWVAHVTKAAIVRSRAPDLVVRKDHLNKASGADGSDSEEDILLEDREQAHWMNIQVHESEGLVHAWCLDQSAIVAGRVGRWLEG